MFEYANENAHALPFSFEKCVGSEQHRARMAIKQVALRD